MEKDVASKLREKDVDESIVDDVHKIFTQADVTCPFEELDTEQKQKKYIQRNFGLVVSIYYIAQRLILNVVCLDPQSESYAHIICVLC